jgi:DNA-binding GntR family transcriptional regulator
MSTHDSKPSPASAPTLAVSLYNEIISDIHSGKIVPGARLEEIELASRYNVSRTPVREALRNLAVTGVVEIRPRRGAIVVDLSKAHLRDILEVVADLEAMAARYAALRMNADARQALRTVHESMGAIVKADDVHEFDRLNVTFHKLVHQGSQNLVLREQIENMRLRTIPYTRMEFISSHDRAAASFSEHDTIVRAIVRGDAEMAFHAMRAHVVQAGSVQEDITPVES